MHISQSSYHRISDNKFYLKQANSYGGLQTFLVWRLSCQILVIGCTTKRTGRHQISECVFLILSKLNGLYHVFDSNFYSTIDELSDNFKMYYFDLFWVRLIQLTNPTHKPLNPSGKIWKGQLLNIDSRPPH